MSRAEMSETGLFAAIQRADDRLEKYAIPLDKQLLVPLNLFDKAHCVMLYEQSIISKEDAAQILRVLKHVDKLGPEGFPWGKGDLWPQKERYLISQIGEETGGRLHTGRSRQDVGVTVSRLHLRGRVLEMAVSLNEFRQVLLELCEKHIETVMPCYTWMQHAQATTFAHYLLSFIFAMARDFERIVHAYKLTNMSPAGAALQTGTSHPLDRHRTKELLGFDKVIRNTRDAAMNSDYLNETMISAALTVLDLLRMLEDFTVWHSEEFSMISLDDAWCGTSSIMPQKRNPYPLMMIRGKASRIFGRATEIFSTLEAPCLGPAVPYYLRSDVDQVIDEFLGAFIMAAGFVSTIHVDEALMRERAGAYWAQATDLADTIVRETQLSFRTAHHIVAELVTMASRSGKRSTDVTSEMIDQAAVKIINRPLQLNDGSVRSALDPSVSVRARKVYGGTSPTDVGRQIDEAKEQLHSDVKEERANSDKVSLALRVLAETVDAIAAA